LLFQRLSRRAIPAWALPTLYNAGMAHLPLTDPPWGRGHPPRLPDYDYAQPGGYFITLCVEGRLPLFGTMHSEAVALSPAGSVIQDTWDQLPSAYTRVDIDAFAVMPDHIHGIVLLLEDEERTLGLPDLVSRFKTLTQKRYRDGVREARWPAYAGRLWQLNYYEHVIRDEHDLQQIRRYILENPLRWHLREQGLL